MAIELERLHMTWGTDPTHSSHTKYLGMDLNKDMQEPGSANIRLFPLRLPVGPSGTDEGSLRSVYYRMSSQAARQNPTTPGYPFLVWARARAPLLPSDMVVWGKERRQNAHTFLPH